MSDVQIGNKKINQLEVKLFVTSMLLQELLDETVGESKFKNKTRFHINGLQKQLDKVLTVEMRDESLSMFITESLTELERFIDNKLEK